MVTETHNLDDIILEIFEEKEDQFFFPVATQNSARAFVKAINSKGYTYEDLGREIEEFEINFSAWRKGLGRPGIGKRVIERINRPLQEILDSDDDEEILQVYRNMTNKKKTQVEANQREIEERLGVPHLDNDNVDSKHSYSNGTSHTQNSSSSSASRESTPLSRDSSSRESTPMSGSSPSKTQSRETTPMTESSMSTGSRESTPASSHTTSESHSRESTPQYNRIEPKKKESELSRMFNKLAHKDKTDSGGEETSSGATSPVKKESSISRESTPQSEDNTAPVPKPRAPKQSPAPKDSDGSDQESFHSAKSTREQTPNKNDEKEGGETREERLAKLQERIAALKKKFPKDDEVENEQTNASSERVTKSEAKTAENERAPIVQDEEQSSEEESEESEEEENENTEISYTNLNDNDEESENESTMQNYDSDLDPEVEEASQVVRNVAKQIANIKSNSHDGHGYVYVFTDTQQEGTTARQGRMKVGVSRNPHKRLQQALEFNVDLQISLTCSVDARYQVLAEVTKDLKSFAIEHCKGWYKGPSEIILDKVSRVADKYPITTSNC